MTIKSNFLTAAAPLALASVLTAAMCAPAYAQVQDDTPPVTSAVDGNGVDVVTGEAVVAPMSIAIGPGGPGSLNYKWSNTNQGQSDVIGFVTVDPAQQSQYTVTIGSFTETFTASTGIWFGVVFTQNQGRSSTLTFDTGTHLFTYTGEDGTVATFSNDFWLGGPFNSAGQITSLTYPSGEKLTYTYKEMGTYPTHVLRSVASSLGYQLRFTSTMVDSIKARVTSAVVFNMADETCDPTADSCTLTGSWPKLTMSAANYASDNIGRSASMLTSGSVETVTYPSGRTETYTRNGSNQVTAFSDGVGTWNYTTATVGGVGQATSASPGGDSHAITYQLGTNRILTDTENSSLTTTYTYSNTSWSGRLTDVKVAQATQAETAYTYDSRGNVTQTRRISSVSGPADIATSASYPTTCTQPKTCNKPTYTIDARGKQTDYTYDTAHGGVLTVTYPADANGVRPQTRYGYTALSANYRNGSGTVIAGTPVYRLTSISLCRTTASCAGTADEVKTTITYDPNQQLLPSSTTTGSGDGTLTATVAKTYTSLGDVKTVDGPLSGSDDTTRIYYDGARRATGIIGPDPDGAGSLLRRATRTTYNAEDQVTSVETGTATSQSDTAMSSFVSLQQVATDFDSHGRQVARRVVAGGVTKALEQYSYTSDGLTDCVAQRMNPAVFATVSGACTPGTPGSGANDFGPDRITKTSYDSFRRPTLLKAGVGTALESSQVTTVYGDLNMVSSVVDADGNRTTYEYDGFQRLAKTRYPSPTQGSGTSSATDYEAVDYDPAGNITTRYLRGYASDVTKLIGYTYDNLGRLTAKNLPGSEPDVSYAYDLLGRLTTAVDSSSNYVGLAYDGLGRQTAASSPLGVIGYGYDLAGRRALMVWPDNFYVTYDHLVTGEVTAIRENGAVSGVGVLVTYAYDNLGRRTTLTRGNGTVTSYGYDGVSRLTSLGINLDGATTTNDLTRGFDYSPAGQITKVTRSNNAYAWPNVARNPLYTTNGLNQYTAGGGLNYGYDARGNITSSGSDSFTYDSENLLTSATVGGVSSTYAYDPMLRLYKSTTTVGQRYQYDGTDLIGLYSDAGTLTKRFVFGPGADEPLVEYAGSGTGSGVRSFLHADERGSIIAQSNESGAKTGIFSYDEYGVPSAGNSNQFQYTGQTFLPQIGMYYYKARLYSPTLGRFMQTDPIGYNDGMNWYNYAHADPINGRDPTGLGDCHPDGRGDNDSAEDCPITVTGHTQPCWKDPGACLVNVLDAIGGAILGYNQAPNAPPDEWGHYTPMMNKVSEGKCNLTPAERKYLIQHFATPFRPGEQAVDNQKVNLWGILKPNPIMQYITNKGFSVVNVTLPGHIFHNNQGGGRVVRTVIIGEDGAAYSSTYGTGQDYNKFLAGINQIGNPLVFGALDSAMAKYIKNSGICK